ncbi:DUF2961 domain-containing protein [Treponema sp. TIM-1]|uniref:glycoside hydrolase family 172 protein n=1 Tax=Treponema sp. TIM-1 TaxID=2898417 RepID=UPI00397F7437
MNSFGLANLMVLKTGKSRSISAENPHGEPGAGGKEASNLGPGRKGRPCITLPQGKETVLAGIAGPGIINSFWMTCAQNGEKSYYILRDLVLRIYWDDADFPSVEVPLGDFFCCGFGARSKVNALPIAVNPTGGMNCYFPMPFRRTAKFTIENQHPGDVPGFFFQINYTLDSVPDNSAYFHAQWRRENLTTAGKDYTILDGVSGKGHYVGTYLAWTALERFWWGEGEMKFYIDGDRDYPTICGTGTEDYFGGAWCFYEEHDGINDEVTYSTAFLGHHYFSGLESSKSYLYVGGRDMRKLEKIYDLMPKHGLYRFHIMDPIMFESDLRVTIQQIGHNQSELFERTDDVASVAYWYQDKPYGKFPKLPAAKERWPR